MATPTCITLTRHYAPLSEKETEEVVGIVADMLVGFMKRGTPGKKPRHAVPGAGIASGQSSPTRGDVACIAQGETHGPQH